ncbi:hypothetical protein LCGC14_2565440 [marine sediment metagenome]|uniref:3D domain-containing protein n=1 Tax=marine sediment metagenome TaxID=412755 RepID=A0A0F9CUZ4_9ZZZZ
MQGSKGQRCRHSIEFPYGPFDRRIRLTVGAIVLAMLSVGFIMQGSRQMKSGFSSPSSEARFCLVLGSGFFSKNNMLNAVQGAGGLPPSPPASTPSMAGINRARPMNSKAGDRSLGNANPRTAASDLDRLLEALILAAPEGEGCKAAPDVPTDTSGFYFTKMTVTAYCPLKCCCGRYADSFTASGHKIQPGQGERFAAAPRQYPFGTMFEVPGYGMAECRDRGGAIKGNKLDLYFDTHTEARTWGIKTLIVKVAEAMK